MISQNDFYNSDDLPRRAIKRKMWRKISKEIKRGGNKILGDIDLRSFIFGLAAAVISFFTLTGIYSTVRNLSENNLPDQIRINNVYKKAIADFEKALPMANDPASREVKVDDWISSRQEEMQNINQAIMEISGDMRQKDFSPLKQKRLRELYRLKLKIIDEIIELEGNNSEIIN